MTSNFSCSALQWKVNHPHIHLWFISTSPCSAAGSADTSFSLLLWQGCCVQIAGSQLLNPLLLNPDSSVQTPSVFLQIRSSGALTCQRWARNHRYTEAQHLFCRFMTHKMSKVLPEIPLHVSAHFSSGAPWKYSPSPPACRAPFSLFPPTYFSVFTVTGLQIVPVWVTAPVHRGPHWLSPCSHVTNFQWHCTPTAAPLWPLACVPGAPKPFIPQHKWEI